MKVACSNQLDTPGPPGPGSINHQSCVCVCVYVSVCVCTCQGHYCGDIYQLHRLIVSCKSLLVNNHKNIFTN